jgi:hypothetical protein
MPDEPLSERRRRFLNERRLGTVVRHLPAGATVLDAACGTGKTASPSFGRGSTVTDNRCLSAGSNPSASRLRPPNLDGSLREHDSDE